MRCSLICGTSLFNSQHMIQHPGGAEILLDVVGKMYKSAYIRTTIDFYDVFHKQEQMLVKCLRRLDDTQRKPGNS